MHSHAYQKTILSSQKKLNHYYASIEYYISSVRVVVIRISNFLMTLGSVPSPVSFGTINFLCGDHLIYEQLQCKGNNGTLIHLNTIIKMTTENGVADKKEK